MRIHKLTSWPELIVVGMLIVIGTLAVKLWPRTVPFDRCSAIYRHYAGIEGIDASFIKDFKINDTLFVDVTLLEAKDSASWATLKHDFSIPELTPEWQARLDNNERAVGTSLLTRENYPITVSSDTMIFDELAISHHFHRLTIFHAKNDQENLAIFYHNLDQSTGKSSN
ncbi:MAG: hypothetical protein MJZ51_04555 [Bacteroidales bacterium]|nr:hypothetical protein [Bacteroidales bacterium]